MTVQSNINIRPINDSGLDANGQGQIKQAKTPLQQFLLNVYGTWKARKPQLFKDVPILDVITPQIAYLTGQGSAEETFAGVGGLSTGIRNGLQYVRYGRNAVNHAANQGKNYAAREGLQFIKSQTENITRNLGKPGTGTPSAPFSFTTQTTAKPSAYNAMTELSKAEAGSYMGGLKPGSVEPVIPWGTRARVAGIDAKNAVKGVAGKVVSGTKNATSGAKGALNKHVGVPLRNAANFMKPQNAHEWKAVGYITAGTTGVAGAGAYVAEKAVSKFNKASKEKTKRDLIHAIPGETKKTIGPTKVEQKAKTNSPVVGKSLQPAASKSKTGSSAPTTAGKTPVPKVTPKVQLPANKQTVQAERVIQTPNTQVLNQPWNSDLQSAEHLAINAERNRLGNGVPQTLTALPGNIQTQQTTSLAKTHPRIIPAQVSKAQVAADAIFTKGRVMGFKHGGILITKIND